jgi:hypothetical protein
VARNTTPDDVPVLRRRENSSSDDDTSSAAQPANRPPANNPPAGATDYPVDTPNMPANNAEAGWEFSPRDRRVIATCLAGTPNAVPAATPNAIPYHKGDTLPYAAQKQAQSLPLTCEKQLPAAGSNTERVIYNQQVLLINTNSLVLDSIDLNH